MPKKAIRFATIFPKVEDVHLMKEIGLIPWGLSRFYGCESTIALLPDCSYPSLKELSGLQASYIPAVAGSNYLRSFLWVVTHARKLDAIHLFYQYRHTRMCILAFLALNPKGLVYVHFDRKETEFNDYAVQYSSHPIYGAFERWFFKTFVYSKRNRSRILWGVQNTIALDNIKGHYPFDQVAYMPDGYFQPADGCAWKLEEKENIILTVGRLGFEQKRTDVLVKGFAQFAQTNQDYKLVLVGPMEQEFKVFLQDFLDQNPQLVSRIQVVGPVYDRETLYGYYAKAKIFCLPSDYESFGIAAAEAQAHGCVLVCTQYPAAYDLTNHEQYGRLIPFGDWQKLAQVLQELTSNPAQLKKLAPEVARYAQEHFSYKALLKPLYQWMEQKRSEDDSCIYKQRRTACDS